MTAVCEEIFSQTAIQHNGVVYYANLDGFKSASAILLKKRFFRKSSLNSRHCLSSSSMIAFLSSGVYSEKSFLHPTRTNELKVNTNNHFIIAFTPYLHLNANTNNWYGKKTGLVGTLTRGLLATRLVPPCFGGFPFSYLCDFNEPPYMS
ncbi:hypothetical protein [Arsenophonus sp.]|uniref:hypothetical protein n=1 Tax=Arsenophonus sp. TaxID=1872640 RepID=UPI00387A24A0